MAAIDTSTNHHNNSNQLRLKKKSTMVDLTPMVDLGFLLITFFVFTTTMSKPTAMNVVMPDDKLKTINDLICNSCALTVLLAKDDVIKYYEGDFATAHIETTNYTGIRDIIQQKKQNLKLLRGNADQFVLIIKPTENSSFKNFVDIADEATINIVKRYYIDEASKAELADMAEPIQVHL